jgi:octanoyl-[GcvH]:protein N-octanoyltransferase
MDARRSLILDTLEESHPQGDFEYALSALSEVSARGEGPDYLRIYQPRPTVAFSGKDQLRPGYEQASAVSRKRGFTPRRRPAGGRAVAYTQRSLIVDHIGHSTEPRSTFRERFRANAELMASSLRLLGIDAGVGELAGEYCPGEFSVHARSSVKLVGAAQRIVKNAWLISAVIQVGDLGRITKTTSEVYRELGLGWDERTAGSIETEAPGVRLQEVRNSVIASYASAYDLAQPKTQACDIRPSAEKLLISR